MERIRRIVLGMNSYRTGYSVTRPADAFGPETSTWGFQRTPAETERCLAQEIALGNTVVRINH